MPALTTEDIKVMIGHRTLSAGLYRISGEITFGDGIKTYPTGGVKLPHPSVFGCPHAFDTLEIRNTVGTPPPNATPPALTVGGDGLYTMQLTQPGAGSMEEIPNTVVPGEQTYRFVATGT